MASPGGENEYQIFVETSSDSFVKSEKSAFVANDTKSMQDKALASGCLEQMVSVGHWSSLRLCHGVVCQYSLEVDELRWIAIMKMHMTGGMPTRGSEFMVLKKKNTWTSMRNIFAVHQKSMMFLTGVQQP